MSAPAAASTSRERTAPLLGAVEALGDRLEAGAREAEELRTLPAPLVEALRAHELCWMKTPLGLGGSELDPLDLCDVLEAIARRDASAAWTTMVANGSTGTMAGWLSDAGIAATFTDPARPPIFAGQLSPRGLAEPVEGGYRVTGRWSFSSGIRHADFVIGGCTQLGDPDAHRFVCVPVAEAKVHDTWHVAGLQGTGSDDFSLEGHFVPEALTFDWATVTVRRGGPLFRQPKILFVGNELSPVAVGIATRAIEDLVAQAAGPARRAPDAVLANRPSFQRELGRGATRLAAARALYREVVAESFAYGLEDRPAPAGAIERILGAHTYVVDVCAEVAWELFRFGGGRALSLSNGLQRHLRNLVAARQHVYVSDENYEQAGQALLSNGAPAAG